MPPGIVKKAKRGKDKHKRKAVSRTSEDSQKLEEPKGEAPKGEEPKAEEQKGLEEPEYLEEGIRAVIKEIRFAINDRLDYIEDFA